MRVNPWLPPLPFADGAFDLVIVISVFTHLPRDSQDAWLAEWSGADAWFVKPVNPFELAATISAAMSRTREEAV